jgi:hypothetical protein
MIFINYECEQKLLWPGFKITPQKYAAGISKGIENHRLAGFRTEIELGTSQKMKEDL